MKAMSVISYQIQIWLMELLFMDKFQQRILHIKAQVVNN